MDFGRMQDELKDALDRIGREGANGNLVVLGFALGGAAFLIWLAHRNNKIALKRWAPTPTPTPTPTPPPKPVKGDDDDDDDNDDDNNTDGTIIFEPDQFFRDLFNFYSKLTK